MRSHEFVTELNIDNVKGWGSTPNNQDVDYMGIRVQMLPSVFLKLAHHLPIDKSVEKKLSAMKQHNEQGGGFGAPMLYIIVPDEWRTGDFTSTAYVQGHEGRHRMNAQLEIEGNKPVETHLLLRGNNIEWRNRNINKEVLQRLNQDMESESGTLYIGPFFTL